MASNTICIGQRQACVLRATRLDEDCTPAEGADNAVVTAGLANLNLEPQVEEGAVFNPPNACGDYLWTAEDPDRILRYTGDFEFTVWDFELIELLTDAALVIGSDTSPWADVAIGVAYPGPTTDPSPGVALEIWVKNAGLGEDAGTCGPPEDVPPWSRYVLPRVRIRPGNRTFNNEASMFTGNIKVSANAQWGEGPWGDWHADEVFPTSPVIQFFDDEIPEASCGYIEVPASTGG